MFYSFSKILTPVNKIGQECLLWFSLKTAMLFPLSHKGLCWSFHSPWPLTQVPSVGHRGATVEPLWPVSQFCLP